MEDPVSIGPWRILGRLGAGGMGVVYRARHVRTGALAAVKTIPTADPVVARSLRREIRALARLRHPGVVRILEDGEVGGVPWYAMVLADGPTLADLHLAVHADIPDTTTGQRHDGATRPDLDGADEATRPVLADAAPVFATSAPADPARIALIYARLAAALAWVHGEGVVHQDLKPSNVIVEEGDLPVLVDFGLARAFAAADGRETFDLGAFGGTAAYVSPEAIRGEAVDARSDLYALGVMLFRALTGRAPFVGTAADVIEGHLHRRPPPPRELVPGIPEGLSSLVLALLAKDRRDRIGHAGVVAERLAGWAGPDAIPAHWPAPRPQLYRPALAGRDDVRSWLDQQLHDGRVALVGAGVGLGKTRLLVELGRKAATGGYTVLTGRAVPASHPAAGVLHPLKGPLEQLADRHRDAPAQVFGEWGAVLAPFAQVPSGSTAPRLPPGQARKRLVTSVVEVLRAAARREPVLVLVDDLHDADAITVEVLEVLAVEERVQPLAVVGTWRSDAPPGPLQALLDRQETARVRLGPLDATAIAALVGDMLAEREPSDALLAFLGAHGEGNPLFVSEYLRAAVERGVLGRDGAGRWALAGAATPEDLGLPRSVDGLLAKRLAALDPELRALAEVAAVLGRDVDAALLARTAASDDERVLDSLRILTERQVLADGPRFAHPALRERLYDGLAPDRRITLHRAAWQALPDEPATLAARAWHAEHAGESEAAARLWLDAGRFAISRYDFAAAEAALRACLRLATPEVALDARFHLAFDVLRPQARLDEAIAETERELADARALGALAAETRAMRSLAAYAHLRGRFEDARQASSAALELDRSRGNLRGVAFGAVNLAHALIGLERSAEAIPHLREALEASRTSGAPLPEHDLLNSLAVCLHNLGDATAAEPLYERAIVAALAEGQAALAGTCRGNLGNLCFTEGRLDEAERHYTEAADLLRAAGNVAGEALVLSNHTRLRRAMSAFEGAAALSRRGAALYRRLGHPSRAAWCEVMLADALHDLGRYAEAAGVVAALELPEGDRAAAAVVAAIRARGARLEGDRDAAQTFLAESRSHLDALGHGAHELPWLIEVAHARRAAGEPPPRDQLVEALRAVAPALRQYYSPSAREFL